MPNLNQRVRHQRSATHVTFPRHGRTAARTSILLTALVALLALLSLHGPKPGLTAPAPPSNIVLVTSQAALNANDAVGWSGLGANGSTVPNTFSATSTLGKTIGGQLLGNGQISSSRIWTKQNGPLTLTFPAVSGVGTFIVNSVNPNTQFTASLAVYNGATLLGTVTRQSDASGNPLYLGATDTTGANITKAVYSLTVAGTIIAPDGTYTYHDYDCFGGNIDPFFCSSLSPSDPLDVDTVLQCPQTTLCTEGFNLPPQPWISSTPNYPYWTGTETNYSYTPDTTPSDLADFYVAAVDFAGLSSAPAINIKGNGMTIANGSSTPSTANDTDFGSTSTSAMVTKTFTIENTGTANLNLTGTPNKVALSGSTDFSMLTQPTSPVAPSGMTTFVVKFAPTATGLKTATVSIANDDSTKNPYTFAIQGGGCDGAPVVQNTNDNGAGSLRQAIADACPGVTITFASPYFDAARTITLTSGQLVLNKNLTIQGTGASKLTISGNNASRVFQINSGVTAGISGLTVTGGNGVGALASGDGGGIYLEGSLTLTGVSVTNNTVAKFGGGIEISSGTLNLTSSTVTNNTAQSGFGGGIDSFNNATLNLTGSTVANNTANCATGNSNGGGGIWNQGVLTITNSTISGNTATGAKGFGGGIRHTSGTLTIAGSTVANNTAQGAYTGGGIENDATLMMTNCTVSGNHADNAGTNNGGGILNYGGPATISASTITGNTAAGVRSAGGLRSDNGTTVTVSNTIIAGNSGTSSASPDVSNISPFAGTFTSQGYNLIGDGTGATGFTGMADQVGTTTNPINALLGVLADNGGLTPTHKLLPGSPAIDKGSAFSLTTDQRGQLRPKNNPSVSPASGGDESDIGAYELQCGEITLTLGTLPSGFIGLPYITALSASGGSQPYSFALTAGSLPPGLTLNPNGTWSGVPASGGTFNFTVLAQDAAGCIGSQTYSLTLLCPTLTLTPATVPGGQVGVAYAQQLAVSNAFANSASYSLNSGTLPPGLQLTVGGTLLGTPTTAGSYNFSVKATDTLGCFGTQSYSLTVSCSPLTIGPTTLATVAAGVPFTQALTANGLGTKVFSFVSNGGGPVSATPAPPAWLTLAPNGVLSGTPTAVGSFTFGVQVMDAQGCPGTRSLTLTVVCPTVTLAALASPTAGTAYTAALVASPASGNYSFALANGAALPNGLTLNNGTLSGTPTGAGTFSFNVVVTGWGSCTVTLPVTLTVACPTLSVPGTLASGVQGQLYSQSVAASPAGGNYSYAVATNLLPPGLSLNASNGAITGTPTAAGNYTFNVMTTGWSGCSKVQTYNLLITNTCELLTVTPSSLPGGSVGTAYNQTVSATGGVSPYTFAVTAGSLPTGLSLNSAGSLSGTPTAVGSFTFTVTTTSTGQGGCTASRNYTLAMTCPTLSITPSSLPNATLGVTYSQTVTASPAGAYTYSLATGNLPPGLSLNATSGVISGQANTPGTYNFTIKAERGAGCQTTKSYAIVANCPTITLSPTTLPNGMLGTTYSQNFSATPTTGTYSYAVAGGTLPPGLTLTTAGSLSGTPTATGSFTFTVRVSGFSSISCNTTRSYTVVISAGCATIGLPPLPATGTRGAAYYGDLSATTPSGTYNFTLVSGTLPPGLALDNLFGALMGTPTAAGTYNFTLQATSAQGCTGTRSYNLVISNGAAARAELADYDGDGTSDLALWSATDGVWRIQLSSGETAPETAWGGAGDATLLGDYDGDGKTDRAVFRPSNATWYVQRSSDGQAFVKVWGQSTDVPVPGDYDGDGQTDLALWRGKTGEWLIQRSRDGQIVAQAWGSAATPYLDVPVPGDYDGDGRTDIAVFRRASGTWLIQRSADGQALMKTWGYGTDVPMAADYDGDGRTDIAVWRGKTGEWFVLRSTDQSYRVTEWGTHAAPHDDQAVPGDYDGDGQTDYAVWRAATGQWLLRLSGATATRTQTQGQRGDRPISRPLP